MPQPFDLGFLGGGQLARMSIQAAQRMGLKCVSLDAAADSPAAQIAASVVGSLDDPDAIAKVLLQAERVTLENEFIPAGALSRALELARCDPGRLIPGIETLACIQDKLEQRTRLRKHGVPSPHAVALETPEQVEAEIGFPMVLKARFGGYDGKGTRYARTDAELREHVDLWSSGGWLAEAFVPFKRELAVMVAHSPLGTIVYPTMETVQTNHVCDLVFPALADASEVAVAAVESVGGNGLFGVELFELENGEILVNEIAPRPHNTGHYTLDWDAPSQFETHVRVSMGFALHPIESQTHVAMANLLGQPNAIAYQTGLRAALKHRDVRVHWYGKAEAKPGRKMGHLNVVAARDESIEHLVERAKAARADFYRGWTER